MADTEAPVLGDDMQAFIQKLIDAGTCTAELVYSDVQGWLGRITVGASFVLLTASGLHRFGCAFHNSGLYAAGDECTRLAVECVQRNTDKMEPGLRAAYKAQADRIVPFLPQDRNILIAIAWGEEGHVYSVALFEKGSSGPPFLAVTAATLEAAGDAAIARLRDPLN